MSKVSICIPAYKDSKGVDRLLESVAEQTYTDIQVIVTDDTPDDSVKNVVSAYEKSLPITYKHNEKPLGPGANWNLSMDMADGEYVKIMHQDDWFTFPDSLEKFVSMLDNDPGAVMAYSGSRQFTISTGEYFDRCITDEHLKLIDKDSRNLYIGQYIGAPSATIIRRTQLRFDPKLKWLIDADFYMGLLGENGTAVCSLEPLVCIGIAGTQMTNDCIESKEVNIREYKHVFKKFSLGEAREFRDRLSYICVTYGGHFADIADCNIPRSEYNEVKRAYRKTQFVFYRDLILRKLHLKQEKRP